MPGADWVDLVLRLGLPTVLVLWAMGMLTYRVWPWWAETQKVRLGFEGKRLQMELDQAAVMRDIALTLGELKQLVSQDRDASLAALGAINEHRKETSAAVSGVAELRVEVAKLSQAKAATVESARKGSVKAAPASPGATGTKDTVSKKKGAATAAKKVS